MTQLLETRWAGDWIAKRYPDASEEVMPGVPWGRLEALFSPAYWASQAWLEQLDEPRPRYRLGATLVEEVAACLLGGHGIPAEVGLAAFRKMRDEGLLQLKRKATFETLHALLSNRLEVGARRVRYRFARQKAQYLSIALHRLGEGQADVLASASPTQARAWLMDLPGVGPKTASWIVRNWFATDDVAILDIHVLRAGQLVGLFPTHAKLPRDYVALEQRFLRFAAAIEVGAARLDALIWMHMRDAPRSVRLLFGSGSDERNAHAEQMPARARKQASKPGLPRRAKKAKGEIESARD